MSKPTLYRQGNKALNTRLSKISGVCDSLEMPGQLQARRSVSKGQGDREQATDMKLFHSDSVKQPAMDL